MTPASRHPRAKLASQDRWQSHGYASSSGNWSTHNCYHADGNGSPREITGTGCRRTPNQRDPLQLPDTATLSHGEIITYLVSSSQTLAASYRYDPYGNTISSSGSLASANVYRFSSKEFHANSGLYYYGYHWYHPNLQRWLNRDPIGEAGGFNLYGFVRNNSVNLRDPWGEQTNPPIIIVPIPTHPPEVPPPLTPEQLRQKEQELINQALSQIRSNWNSVPYSCQHHLSLDAHKTQGGTINTGNGLPANMASNCEASQIGTPRNIQNTTMTCSDGKTVVKCIKFERCDKNVAGTGQSWQPHKTCATCPDGSKENY